VVGGAKTDLAEIIGSKRPGKAANEKLKGVILLHLERGEGAGGLMGKHANSTKVNKHLPGYACARIPIRPTAAIRETQRLPPALWQLPVARHPQGPAQTVELRLGLQQQGRRPRQGRQQSPARGAFPPKINDAGRYLAEAGGQSAAAGNGRGGEELQGRGGGEGRGGSHAHCCNKEESGRHGSILTGVAISPAGYKFQ
jgi:hypothetical protein